MSSEIIRFYKAHLPLDEDKIKGAEVKTSCPFHSDNNPSFSINTESGLFKCHTQGCPGSAGGNMYQFYQLIHKEDGMSIEQAKDEVTAEYEVVTSSKTPEKAKAKPIADFPITEAEVEVAHRDLLKNENVMKILSDDCLWTEDTIKENQLGFDCGRVWIPIREKQKLVNIRKYARNPNNGSKVISVPGFGQARLWPLGALEFKEIYLFEGEKDRILAAQLGLNAVTITGGAGTFEIKWIPLFKGKTVVICYDIDNPGREGAKKISKLLMHVSESVKTLHLPLEEPDNADFTDYIKAGNSIQDFQELVASTIPVQPPETREIAEEVIEIHTEDAIKREKFCRRLKSKVRIVSSRLPSIIPKGLLFSCNRSAPKFCVFCPHQDTGEAKVAIDERNEVILRYLSSGIKEDKMIHKDVFDPPCPAKHWNVTESVSQRSVEEVEVAPTVDDLDISENMYQRFDEYKMYVIDKRLDLNSDYEIEFVLYKHPLDREVTSIIYKAQPCKSTLNSFTLDKEMITKLKEFQCEENTPEVEPNIQGLDQ
jgi:hypothetical protein